ncbi:hypothetical protein NQ317_002165 [Molorchus minor]|uniref:Division abnormally delayed protein n=1 Tax=Molorchus minor TaxID=1323400 RepID=A0ABQ9IU28_9CUCU|nr:hypothetical protein NQ317_002165 [Molorchus minor]
MPHSPTYDETILEQARARPHSAYPEIVMSFDDTKIPTYHVSELARQSENKTLLLFSQVYRGMAVLSREPIEDLYRDIRNYIYINSTNAKPTTTPEEIVNSVTLFFTDLFPLAYHHSADISNKDFTRDYKECLKKSFESISPFGDIPKQIALSLSKSLEGTRLLLQAFRIGAEVLNTTDTLLIDEGGTSHSECHNALVEMTYCPRCLGMTRHVKPCSGYCLNVLRGCIAKYVAELDLPWNGYVEGIGEPPQNLDTKISAAIMHYMEKAKDIDARHGKWVFTGGQKDMTGKPKASQSAFGGSKTFGVTLRVLLNILFFVSHL